MRKSVFLLSLFVLPMYMLLQAQEKTAPFWGKQEVYLMNQTEKTFHLVDALLKENPTFASHSIKRYPDEYAFITSTRNVY